ncbi:succinylglutamate desuccinylase/aspartoacylase family protein, partial [bacterium]|nr:succinylglutamate desuccinylase/aspartoacylase family protein [bacterium]
MSFLSLYFLIYLSSPIVEIEKNDYTTQFVKRYNPYLYHQTKDSYIILKDETTSNNMKLKAIPFKIKYSSEADYKLERKSISNRAGFITYEEISDKMDAIVSTGDGLFEKISLGTTIEGRDIWALRNITNSPKPKFRVAGATHGDEAMSYQLVYQFMSDFFDKKNQEPYKTLLQEIQFTWIPMINPDGAVNVDRYNSNGIDLNRNFGFFWERGSSYGLEPFSEPETKAIRNDLLEELYSISFSFHTYGDYINYVWNFSEDDVSDQEEIEYLSGLYFDETDYTVVKGYDWYRTTGDLNDYSYGTTGDIDWTIEVADPLQNKDSIYAKNRDAMLSVFSKYQQGVEGIIKNSDGETLFGAIVLKNKGTLIYSQRDNGYFYRYLEAGSYEGTVFVAGYESQNITFTVTENSKENLNIVISNKVDYLYPILVTETVVDLDPTSNYENILLPKNALFESDNIGFSMNGDGYVVFEIPYFEGDYEIKLNLKSGTMNTLKLYSKNDIDSDSVSIQKNSDGKYIFPQGDRYLKIVESITQINQKTAVIDNILIEKVVIDYCNPNPCLDGEAFKTVCIANENGYSCNCIENLVLDENGVCNCPENLVLDENGVCNCP